MNPLTLVKRIQNINAKEASLGISEEASWHAKYKDSAYVFVGGVPFDLTEGDLLAVFAQYGEIVDVNLVRDKGTGKSKGFAFVAYEDQRSTNLAVDNLNGAQVLGRTIRVDHVTKYKKKEEEDEETERQKREARGVCRAFQRGECTRGAGCKFSHDEQRAANTGWGPQDHKTSRWGHDKFEGPTTSEKRSIGEKPSGSRPKQYERAEEKKLRGHNDREIDPKSREDYSRREEKRSRRHGDDEFAPKLREDGYKRDEKKSRRYEDDEFERKTRDSAYKREEKKSRKYEDDEVDPKSRDYDYKREEKRSKRNEGVEYEPKSRDGGDYRREDDRSKRHDEDDGSKPKLKGNDFHSEDKRSKRFDGDDFEPRSRRDDGRKEEKSSTRHSYDSRTRKDDDDRMEEKNFRRHDSESHLRDGQEKRGRDSGYSRDTSHHDREKR